LKPNAYTTMQRARSLRERHSDVSTSLVAVALAAATFADGPTGTMIRPRHQRIAEIVGLSVGRVNKLMQELVKIGELRRDKTAWRGSAACYTWIGGMVVAEVPPLEGLVVARDRNGGARATTHLSHLSEPSGLEGPRDGDAPHPRKQRCSICTGHRELVDGSWCADCRGVMTSGDGKRVDALLSRHKDTWR
jgi:hypothetical protein